MRVLLVVHDFLPDHRAGTEIYTYQLALELKRAGHEVHVFTTEKDVSLPNLSVRVREYGGVAVHELINNLFYNDFRETWDYPAAERSFARFLDDLQPDAVHFMHLMYLSVGCVEEAARRGLPVLFTLHDYWLQCPRFGQRVHAAGTFCHTIDFNACGQCLSSFKFKQTRVERATAKGLARLKSALGFNLAPLARELARSLKAQRHHASSSIGIPAATLAPREEQLDANARALASEARARDEGLRQRLVPAVSHFLAPSHFLRERMLEWGIAPEKISSMRTGIDVQAFRNIEHQPSERLRIAFLGTLAPHKGAHLLLRAWERIPAELRARGSLALFGPKKHNPDYVRLLLEIGQRMAVEVHGPLDRDEVPRQLARTDLLVVPSIWYENSPLIILEALAARVPLLVSDLGGMAELVQAGLSGFHFRVGDEDHLREILSALLQDRSPLSKLYPIDLPVRSVERDAQELGEMYARLAQEAHKGR